MFAENNDQKPLMFEPKLFRKNSAHRQVDNTKNQDLMTVHIEENEFDDGKRARRNKGERMDRMGGAKSAM